MQDDVDEVTWQTYKGQLTEKQEKTREKVIKRTEKASGLSLLGTSFIRHHYQIRLFIFMGKIIFLFFEKG